MPVKNIKRKTNDGLQGIIVGLTDEEKQALIKDGVGKSVSPCLNLVDLSSKTPTIRTSITEEEKTNLEKGLYNSVMYVDPSLGNEGMYISSFPEILTYAGGALGFSTYNISESEETGSISIVGSSVYVLAFGEKSADGTYPITIEKQFEATFGSGASVTIRRW